MCECCKFSIKLTALTMNSAAVVVFKIDHPFIRLAKQSKIKRKDVVGLL